MVSLEFFPEGFTDRSEKLEWGTGKLKDNDYTNLWIPKRPTWQYRESNIPSKYDVTSLRRSNVRLNDQLLPKPQECHMRPLMIEKPFPAEHPFTSHIEQKAVFPGFANVPEDPVRGVKARRRDIRRHEEMPAQPDDLVLISKSKGSGLHHSIQRIVAPDQRPALEWPELPFDQVVKSAPNGREKEIYPTPPTLLMPNLKERQNEKIIKGNMEVTPRTANTTRNLERAQWMTTYDLSHTGLGDAAPMALDNLDDKSEHQARTNSKDDSLKPRMIRNFVSPRPLQGRVARTLTPKPPAQTDKFVNPAPDPEYTRPLSVEQYEDKRLLEGKEYVSLPADAAKWKPETPEYHNQLRDSGYNSSSEERTDENEPSDDDEFTRDVVKFRDDIQQMEAQNRWKLLKSDDPGKHTSARGRKMALASTKSQPDVFYNNEATYQTERAGLYETSYKPERFQNQLSGDQKRGAAIMDHSDSHVNALDLPTNLNTDMADAMRWSRTQGGPPSGVLQGHSQPSQHEAFEPFTTLRKQQLTKIQPSAETANPRVQEGHFLQQESTMGDSYNTTKFLQNDVITNSQRRDPSLIMSAENQQLNAVRSARTVRFADDVTIHSPQSDTPRVALTARTTSNNAGVKLPVSLQKERLAVRGSDPQGQLASRASAFTAPPGLARSWTFTSAADQQFSKYRSPAEEDQRLSWRPGDGPRPQTSLTRLQNSFTKSATRKKFHRQFPENQPDLRENLVFGKKHSFGGLNAQILRGTPVID